MKLKLTLTFLMVCGVVCVNAQGRKWYWVGGHGSATTTFQTVSNWNSKLGGGTGGTVHPGTNNSATSITKGDTLVIDGSNIGFGEVAIDTIRIPIVTQNEPARIHVINGARVLFHKSTATGTNTLTITPNDPNGSSDGKDVYIDASSGITMGHNGLGTGAVVLSLNVKARALIEGNLTIVGGINNRLAVPANGMVPAVRFAPGSRFRSWVINASAFNNAGPARSILFEPGSSLVYEGLYSPEGNSATVQMLNFMPGSNYIINSSTTGQPGSFFNSKTYGNVIIGDGVKTVTVTTGGGGNKIDTLTVKTNASFTLGGSSSSAINGDLNVEGTFTTAGTQTVVFDGNGIQQAIKGSGALTFPNIIVDTSANLELRRNITVTTTATIIGKINFGTYRLTDNGATTASFTTKPGAALQTAHASGFDPATGSVLVQGNKTYEPGTSYIIDGPTTTPFGISTVPGASPLTLGYLKVNATGVVTTNSAISITDSLVMRSGLLTIRASDAVTLVAGASLKGSNFGPANYIVTNVDQVSGAKAIFTYAGIATPTTVPLGSPSNYLPVTFRPDSPSDFTMTVFEGATDNAEPNGSLLPAAALDTMVNAVWNINRTAGTGDCDVTIQWTAALEGNNFKTLALSNIGISSLDAGGPAWQTPVGTGLANRTARAIFGNFSPLVINKFAAGIQQVIFDPLPAKTYGDGAFDPGAVSNQLAVPITYSSSNTQIAVINGTQVQIVGAGTVTITAAQAGAASRTQQLFIEKAALTIKANDSTMRPNNPITGFSFTYSGFKNGDDASKLTVLPTATSDATTSSPEGVYVLIPGNAQSPNYTFIYLNGVLTLSKDPQSITFTALGDKLYGDADFNPGAVASSNLPIKYTSSNEAVAITVDNDTKVRVVGIGLAVITATQPGDASYTKAVNIPQNLRVNKAPLIIQPGDAVKMQGQPNPEFKTIKYTGFVNGENASILTRQPVVSTTAVVTSFAGNYPIIASEATAVNYNIVFVPGTLTVEPIDESKAPRQLNAYTNSNSTVRVQIKVAVPGTAEIFLYDSNGKPMARRKVVLNHASGVNDFDIPVYNVSPGIYIVQVTGEGWKLQKNITILR